MEKKILFVVVLVVVCSAYAEENVKLKRRVAIIGSGIGGSSSAYWLKFPNSVGFNDFDVDVVVYEQLPYVGGRVNGTKINNTYVEIGAGIVHSSNRYFSHFVDIFGLTKLENVGIKGRIENANYGMGGVGIWNGKDFSFLTSIGKGLLSKIYTFISILYRYGWSFFRAESLCSARIKEWEAIYQFQNESNKTFFASPVEMMKKLGLDDITQISGYEFFEKNRVSQTYVKEFMDGITRVNYGQCSDVNAFVDLVSLAGAGTAGSLFSVDGGNVKVVEKLLEKSEAVVKTNTLVTKIIKSSQEGESKAYKVVSYKNDEDPLEEGEGSESTIRMTKSGSKIQNTEKMEVEEFDGVIIAAPLESASIVFEGFELPKEATVRREYQVTHVTFVVGHLNGSYFGFKAGDKIPDLITTIEDASIPFSSIGFRGLTNSSHEKVPIYKMFSRSSPSTALLNQIFISPQKITKFVWDAYPVLNPRPWSEFQPFKLNNALCNVNAVETIASAVEVSIVGARNCVISLLHDFRQN